MMKYALLSTLLLLTAQHCDAQMMGHEDLRELLVDDDVFEMVVINKLVILYRTSSLPSEEASDCNQHDLHKLPAVSHAVQNGQPGIVEGILIHHQLSGRHHFELDEATVVNTGDRGFLWRIKGSLYPAEGGLGGVPYQYLALLHADGTPIPHENAFVDHCLIEREDAAADEASDLLFSVIPFADFAEPKEDEKPLHGDEILSRADTKLKSALGNRPGFRFHGQQLIDVPILHANDGRTQYRKLWEVQFIPASNDPAGEQHSAITLWATADGRVGDLTINKWSLKK